MKLIFKSIGILIGLIFFAWLISLVPVYVNGTWVSYGEAGSLLPIFLGLIPIIIFILLHLDIIDVYSLPFSDLFDVIYHVIIYILVIVTSCLWSSFESSLSNAISLILTVFIILYPLYLFYDDIVSIKLRRKIKSRFLKIYLPAVVFGGVIVLLIGLSYFLTLFDVYLPGNAYLLLGVCSDFLPIPILYVISIGATILFFLYNKIFYLFKPKKEYKYAKYSYISEDTETTTSNEKSSSSVRCCKYCRYWSQRIDYEGRGHLYCKLDGVDTSEYYGCDSFSE